MTHLIYLLHNSGLKLSELSEWDETIKEFNF